MIHGSSDAPASVVKDPLDLSKAQKNSVLLGCPSRFTGMFPAKLRGRESVTLGRVSVTSKSVWVVEAGTNGRYEVAQLTSLPGWTIVDRWNIRVWMRECVGEVRCVSGDEEAQREKRH